MTPNLHLWLIPVLPLVGAAINGLFGKRFSRQTVAAIALGFSGAAFAMALWVATQASLLPVLENLAPWIRAGDFQVDFAFYLDQLSLVMLLVVTGVGFLIHIYSVGYMWEEGGFYRFFAYLNLFMFFMLTLVLGSNYLVMFIGWEGVGLASYLLIGFWFTKDSAASAGKKAFIVNRIGDFGFLIALFLMIKHFGSLNFVQVFRIVSGLPAEAAGAGLLTSIGLAADGGSSGKICADSSLRLAAGRDGRPDAGFRTDPCRDDGDSGRIYGGAVACDFRPRAAGIDGRSNYRHADGVVCCDDWNLPNRHQEGSRLFDHFATGIHVHGLWRGCVFCGYFPPHDSCIFQRIALPRSGICDSRGGR